MSVMGIPPESPDPSISDAAFVTEKKKYKNKNKIR